MQNFEKLALFSAFLWSAIALFWAVKNGFTRTTLVTRAVYKEAKRKKTARRGQEKRKKRASPNAALVARGLARSTRVPRATLRIEKGGIDTPGGLKKTPTGGACEEGWVSPLLQSWTDDSNA